MLACDGRTAVRTCFFHRLTDSGWMLPYTLYVSPHTFCLALAGHAASLSIPVALSGCVSLTLRSRQVSPFSRRNQEVEANPIPALNTQSGGRHEASASVVGEGQSCSLSKPLALCKDTGSKRTDLCLFPLLCGSSIPDHQRRWGGGQAPWSFGTFQEAFSAG